MSKEKEAIEKIAEFCHDNDFTTGMAEEPYVAESWGVAPDEVKQSYRKDAIEILKIVKSLGYRLPPAGDLREAVIKEVYGFHCNLQKHKRVYPFPPPEFVEELLKKHVDNILSLFPHHELKASEKPNFCCSQCGGYNWNETPRGKFHCQICGHWVNADGSTYTVAQCAADKKREE